MGGGTPDDISGFSKIKSIVATEEGIVGLRTNGTCVSTDPGFTYSYINECRTWTNIKQIAAGTHHVIGLREDGTCASHRIKWNTGYGYDGQCDVSSWKDIKYITCGGSFTAGLKYDGTVVIAGETDYSRVGAARDWKDIEFIEAYSEGIIAVNKDGKVLHSGRADISSITSAKNIVDVAVYRGKPYALLADGTLLGDGCRDIKDVVAISSGSLLYMLKQDGSIAVKGSSYSYGKKTVPNTLRLFKSYDELIARIEAEENAALEEKRLKKEKEEARKNQIYEEAVSYIGSGDIKKCKEAEILLSSIVDWNDSSDKLAVLRNEIVQLKAEEKAKKKKPAIIVCFVVLVLIAAVFFLMPKSADDSQSGGAVSTNSGGFMETNIVENKGEFVAITMNSIKRVDSDSLTVTLKKEAPEADSNIITEHINGYPIVLAEKIVEGGKVSYIAIKGDNLIKCTDGTVYAKSNYREEPDQNYGLYGERNDAYSIYVYNIFAEEVGTYTLQYGNEQIQIQIKLPECGLYTEPEAALDKQMLSQIKKGDVVYMIVSEPEQYETISFNVFEEDDASAVNLEQMGEYGEICKITAVKSGAHIRMQCVREFADGSRDDSGDGFYIE